MRKTTKINWTKEMTDTLIKEYYLTFNKELSIKLGVSPRSLIRKARELGMKKDDHFLETNRQKITKLAQAAKGPNKYLGVKGFCVPGGERFWFKKGHIPVSKDNPELMAKIHEKRNALIKRDRLRLAYGLDQISKLKLKPKEL